MSRVVCLGSCLCSLRIVPPPWGEKDYLMLKKLMCVMVPAAVGLPYMGDHPPPPCGCGCVWVLLVGV